MFDSVGSKTTDTLNSKLYSVTWLEIAIIALVNEIKLFRSSVDVYDPIANNKETRQEFKINIIDKPRKSKYDLVVIAVGHQIFKKIGGNRIRAWCKPDGIIVDLKNTIPKNETDFTL